GKTGGLDQISNKDAIILYCLTNGVEVDFATLICEDITHKLNKKTREKVFPYPWFISLLLEYMMPTYEFNELTINPTQVFSVHNWALKLNQPEAEKKGSQGKKPGAKSGLIRKQSSKHTSESKTKAHKFKTSHLNQETKSSSTLDKNPSQSSTSTPMVAEMHKDDQQAAGGPTSLGVTGEEGADPQLNSGMSAFIHIKPVYSASFIIYYKSVSGCDASVDSTSEADPGISYPNDSIPQQHGIDKGT
ncbi:hypothetical protein Tco_1095439, partial [Tanacetum coccineum]